MSNIIVPFVLLQLGLLLAVDGLQQKRQAEGEEGSSSSGSSVNPRVLVGWYKDFAVSKTRTLAITKSVRKDVLKNYWSVCSEMRERDKRKACRMAEQLWVGARKVRSMNTRGESVELEAELVFSRNRRVFFDLFSKNHLRLHENIRKSLKKFIRSVLLDIEFYSLTSWAHFSDYRNLICKT